MAARAAVSSVTINKLLVYVTYLLDDASSKIITAPAIDFTRPAGWVFETPSHTLLELPAEMAAHGFDCYDLTMLHLPASNVVIWRTCDRPLKNQMWRSSSCSSIPVKLEARTRKKAAPASSIPCSGSRLPASWGRVGCVMSPRQRAHAGNHTQDSCAFRELYDFAVDMG